MDEQGVSNLERRYRLLLRVLPKWYRQDREEEMAGLFLADRTDELDLEHSWPGWGETAARRVRTARASIAAGSAPGRAVWLGEVVRALGMLGLLLGVFYTGVSITNAVQLYNDPDFTWMVTWERLFAVMPIVAFVALLSGKRTPAKIAAFVALLPVVISGQPGWLLWWVPSIVAFVCLCLGFHREAPIPPARRLAWWGGGALLLGVAAGLIGAAALLMAALAVVITRLVAHLRGDVVLGRALSLFAVLLLPPTVSILLLVVHLGMWVHVVGLVAAALLVVSAAAPVTRASVLRSRLP